MRCLRCAHCLLHTALSTRDPSGRTSLSDDLQGRYNILTNVLKLTLIFSVLLLILAKDIKVINIISGLRSLKLLSNGTISVNIIYYSLSKAALNYDDPAGRRLGQSSPTNPP